MVTSRCHTLEEVSQRAYWEEVRSIKCISGNDELTDSNCNVKNRTIVTQHRADNRQHFLVKDSELSQVSQRGGFMFSSTRLNAHFGMTSFAISVAGSRTVSRAAI